MSGFDQSALAAAIAAHGPVVRVVITDFAGSSPRETGAAMLVWSDGQSGTIGGGALEWQAAEAARRLLGAAEQSRRMQTYPLGPALGQCCGGSVTLLSELYHDAAMGEPQQGAPGSAPAGFVARPVTSGDAPTRELAPLPLGARRAAQAIRDGRGQPLTCADGWIVEALRPANIPVFIYGAGHVGRAIAHALHGLPFDVTLVDDAPARFPDPVPAYVSPLMAANPAEAVPLAPARAVHLVLTYSHALDLEICHRVLQQPFAHLGLIGSATKSARFRKRLAELGHTPAQIARLACPIGDRSLGKEPAAIALGVAAELLRLARAQTASLEATA
ncbi:xanthine dehydrogenase accessory factor [Rubricella aquisinus]|uniref:Xanthine dehydrogenase accessory factor n=1 Tax=Rubricella aquisinus TaxID=2028108 RepID=A0A840WIZ0_9RHOB|nr:xanthine dehydrogenase accessory factor [Rubricella aquisinus]